MKKLSVTIQWLFVLAIVGFCVYVVVRPTPQPAYSPDTWQDWSGINVLSYAGIAREDSEAYPSLRTLEAQLTGLRDAGYRTVRPEDVRAYLDEHAPLPEKALLLIFEGGRKEAFIRATPVLQRTGFTAVIVVPTSVMTQWGGFYLKKKDIRKVVRLPQWQVGSMGHQAIAPAPGFATADEGHFLVQRGRVDGQTESTDAFQARIAEDYAASAKLLGEAVGKPPLLYLYPFAEAGQSPSSDPMSENINREAVTRYFSLAFIGGFNSFNGPGSDPWTLTRLRVPGNWSPERLVAELASSQPRSRPAEAIGGAQEWVFERAAGLQDAELHFATNAVAWLRGTDAWTDMEVNADLHNGPDATGALYARYTGLRSWVRVAVDGESLRVQERIGSRLYTLFQCAAPAGEQGERRIRLRLRNNRAWVWLNGNAVASNLPLAPQTARGRIGLGCDTGDVRVSAFSARPLPSRWLLANSIRLVPDAQRDQVQAVLPNWFRQGTPAALAHTAQQDLLQAAVSGIRTIPLLSGCANLDDKTARDWAAAVDNALIRADVKMLTPVLAVDGPAFALADELRNRNYRVAHLLDAEQMKGWGRALAQQTPDETLAVNDRGDAADQALVSMKHVIPTSRLALREADGAALAPGLATLRLYDSPTER